MYSDEEDGFPLEEDYLDHRYYVDGSSSDSYYDPDDDVSDDYDPASEHFKIDKRYNDIVKADIEEGTDVMLGLIYDYYHEGDWLPDHVLHIAIRQQCDLQLFKSIIEGTDVNLEFEGEGVRFLSVTSADLTTYQKGDRALHFAVDCDFPSIEHIRLLLDSGCDLNAVNYIGETAVMIAQRRGFHDIVEELLSRGAQEIEKFQLNPFLFNQLRSSMDAAENDEYAEWEE